MRGRKRRRGEREGREGSKWERGSEINHQKLTKKSLYL
jgi:hypothetical protein